MNLNNTYNIKVQTPLGIENATVNLCHNGLVSIYRGSASIQHLNLDGNNFTFTVDTDVPFKCHLKFQGVIQEDKISGKIYLDEYLESNFTGEKSDEKLF